MAICPHHSCEACSGLIYVLQSAGQEYRWFSHDRDYYLVRSAKLSRPPFILLGEGTIATTAGILILHNYEHSNNLDDELSGLAGGLLSTAAGAGAIITSIPLFAVSAAMKRKVARLSFNNLRVLLPAANSFVARAQPTFTFSIRL